MLNSNAIIMVSKRKRGNEFAYMLIQAKPVVKDPRELSTIIRSSLKSWFGETEPHGGFVEVLEANRSFCVIKCPESSLSATRVALTFPAPPPYLQETHFCFDVLKIQSDLEALQAPK